MEFRSDQGEFKIKQKLQRRKMTRYTFLKGQIYHLKNIDNPEYYFQTSKVKFIPGKSNNRFN
jgi:hypothetical protein